MASIIRRDTPHSETVEVVYCGVTRQFCTYHGFCDQGALLGEHLPLHAGARQGRIYSERIFGGHGYYDAVAAAQGGFDTPVSWLQGDACTGRELSGVQVCTIRGAQISPIVLDGDMLGYLFEDAFARYCFLSGIISRDLSLGREAQTRAVFERIEEALGSVGMVFTDVVRTWIYLDRLLEWYDPFNVVRTRFFETRGVFDMRVPASTGIGAANPAGAACLIDAYAVQPKGDTIRIQDVSSPMQCSAQDYRSSFSRAVEVAYPGMRELYISGTASIHPDGETAHVGDIRRQVVLTMEVLQALLASRGMGWSDTVRGIAYFKTLRDVDVYAAVCRELGIPRLPMALAHADVCRDDLLFEVELDAIRGGAV